MTSSSSVKSSSLKNLLIIIFYVSILAYFFANVEIAIEGPAGWAANLPTWRIEKHWLLDIFWGGRAMTGYHAWVFPFIALFFHSPIIFSEKWSLAAECKILASIILFWLAEDFLWFVINPAFTITKFHPEFIPWHKHWILFAPTDYWVGSFLILFLFSFSLVKQNK